METAAEGAVVHVRVPTAGHVFHEAHVASAKHVPDPSRGCRSRLRRVVFFQLARLVVLYRAAEERLSRCLGALRAAGAAGEGIVGDDDPLLAIDDSLPAVRRRRDPARDAARAKLRVARGRPRGASPAAVRAARQARRRRARRPGRDRRVSVHSRFTGGSQSRPMRGWCDGSRHPAKGHP